MIGPSALGAALCGLCALLVLAAISGRFSRSRRADRFAEEMAALLGLPLIEPPPRGRAVSPGR